MMFKQSGYFLLVAFVLAACTAGDQSETESAASMNVGADSSSADVNLSDDDPEKTARQPVNVEVWPLVSWLLGRQHRLYDATW